MSRAGSRAATALVAVLALTAAGLGGTGCRGDSRHAVDEKLLLALEEARALQHRADLHLESGETADAVADVRAVLAIAFPAGSPEGEETRLDAWARLARLALQVGHEDEALAAVDSGRKEATFDSFYRAHLETVSGEALEARAKRLGPTDAEGANAARREAIAAYSRSIDINKRVQAALAGRTR